MSWTVIYYLLFGALAQLVAHHTGSVGVSGSNPLCSTDPEVLRNKASGFSFYPKKGFLHILAFKKVLQPL